MSTENIQLFIRTNYSDSQLAALIAHTESGRLSYRCCCCLVGIANSPHALTKAGQYDGTSIDGEYAGLHFLDAMHLPHAREAHIEFQDLGGPDSSDELRRERLLPLLYAEVERREQERDYEDDGEYWNDSKGMAEMVNSIKGR